MARHPVGRPDHLSVRARRTASRSRRAMLADGRISCYASAEELAQMREAAKAEGRAIRYDGRWRDRDPSGPEGVKPVIRLRAADRRDRDRGSGSGPRGLAERKSRPRAAAL
jgi:hypothetical protein